MLAFDFQILSFYIQSLQVIAKSLLIKLEV